MNRVCTKREIIISERRLLDVNRPTLIYYAFTSMIRNDVSLYLKCHSPEYHIDNPMFWLIWPCYALTGIKCCWIYDVL